jgi:hypothetical protein
MSKYKKQGRIANGFCLAASEDEYRRYNKVYNTKLKKSSPKSEYPALYAGKKTRYCYAE